MYAGLISPGSLGGESIVTADVEGCIKSTDTSVAQHGHRLGINS